MLVVVCIIGLLLIYGYIKYGVESFVSYNEYQDSDKVPVLHFDVPRTDFLNFNTDKSSIDATLIKIPSTESFELSRILLDTVQKFIDTRTNEKTKVNKIYDIEWVDNHDDTRTFLFKTDVLFAKGMFSVPVTTSITLNNVSRYLINIGKNEYFLLSDSITKNIVINSITVISPRPFNICVSTNGLIDNLFYIKNKFGLLYPFKTSYNEFVKK